MREWNKSEMKKKKKKKMRHFSEKALPVFGAVFLPLTDASVCFYKEKHQAFLDK